MPTFGWAPSWRMSSPTWHASASCARSASTLVPSLGIAFVAMKRNVADLPDVLRLGLKLGARQFSVSNVLPVTSELQGEMLYTRCQA